MPDNKKRFPLHIHIATLFIGLILAVGLVLGGFNHRNNAKILLSASERLFDQINREVMLDFQATHGQTANTIDLLVQTPVTAATTLPARLASLSLFTTALQHEPALSAIQVGYANGDYFIVRPLHSPFMKDRFAAPAQAAYVVDNITAGEQDQHPMLRIFFTSGLEEIARRKLPATRYDPRRRDWYRLAMQSRDISIGKPYLYYFIRKVGFTIGRKSAEGQAVVAADVTLESLSTTIARHPVSPSAEVVLFGDNGKVLAYRDPAQLVVRGDGNRFEMADIQQLASPVLAHIGPELGRQDRQLAFRFGQYDWLGTVRKIVAAKDLNLYLAIVAPKDELLTEAYRISREATVITVLILLLALPVAWLFARKITRSLRTLSRETDLIRQLDFRQPIRTRSRIREIAELAEGMDVMKDTINKFLRLITSLAGEQDFDRMLRRIARETLDTSQADEVGVLLLSEDEQRLQATLRETARPEATPPAVPDIVLADHPDNLFIQSLSRKEAQLASLSKHQAGAFPAGLPETLHADRLQLAAFPLINRHDEAIGVLYVAYRQQTGAPRNDDIRERLNFIQALSGFAAVSLETRMLLKSQKALLEAFIRLIAGAIDAKSPYTGGHCQRVPVLTRMLATAASESEDPPFRDYHPTAEDWEAIHIASWLHDCGKVTTPEYVVDKSTKLETLYDRIHEIRTRFEVLKRDAQIEYWQAVAKGGDQETLQQALERKLASLDDDFAFVAECNEGGEFMAPERIERLRRIASRTWQRTLDNRLGVSWEEKQRIQRRPAATLPVTEPLLADKPEHILYRDEAERIPPDNPWGFKLDVPEFKFNRGELYNLSVERGTLTTEERYLINDHIVQTIIMLEQLPYPRHLREVPAIAGGHHEKMDGTGYPRRLRREEMSLTARMMAIADIFEALTASDRPYKKAKTLSEAIRIMRFMKQDQHIDPDLFELFLRSGIYREYAKKYLSPEQIDEVDVEACLS
ncbi:MAG TPA: HAMP domain-containing protein [Chromatiales bacterium]|nr:HAMP domain-containing protein [Chromatiales bacterium]